MNKQKKIVFELYILYFVLYIATMVVKQNVIKGND